MSCLQNTGINASRSRYINDSFEVEQPSKKARTSAFRPYSVSFPAFSSDHINAPLLQNNAPDGSNPREALKKIVSLWESMRYDDTGSYQGEFLNCYPQLFEKIGECKGVRAIEETLESVNRFYFKIKHAEKKEKWLIHEDNLATLRTILGRLGKVKESLRESYKGETLSSRLPSAEKQAIWNIAALARLLAQEPLSVPAKRKGTCAGDGILLLIDQLAERKKFFALTFIFDELQRRKVNIFDGHVNAETEAGYLNKIAEQFDKLAEETPPEILDKYRAMLEAGGRALPKESLLAYPIPVVSQSISPFRPISDPIYSQKVSRGVTPPEIPLDDPSYQSLSLLDAFFEDLLVSSDFSENGAYQPLGSSEHLNDLMPRNDLDSSLDLLGSFEDPLVPWEDGIYQSLDSTESSSDAAADDSWRSWIESSEAFNPQNWPEPIQ
jgi:hypothetical protein